jgi:hypothetical protein
MSALEVLQWSLAVIAASLAAVTLGLLVGLIGAVVMEAIQFVRGKSRCRR